jgi:uncharacterized membrane protein YgdD (TMEM256/DUF423 family)
MAERGKPLLAGAALSAAMAIAAGAFGAHAAYTPHVADLLRTGASYQLVHAVAVFALATRPGLARPSLLLLLGSLIFAISLYLLALGKPSWLGAITPIGGVLMIAGWLWAAWTFAKGGT